MAVRYCGHFYCKTCHQRQAVAAQVDCGPCPLRCLDGNRLLMPIEDVEEPSSSSGSSSGSANEESKGQEVKLDTDLEDMELEEIEALM